uniref:Uncharacterized protein n=1 Tax=Aegilops tauschii subsp. strangulata TaxID=200361 RepID=A0A452Y2W4_AEGTS
MKTLFSVLDHSTSMFILAEKNTFILIGMETPVRIECIIVIISYYVWSADMLAYSCNISLLYLLSLSNF